MAGKSSKRDSKKSGIRRGQAGDIANDPAFKRLEELLKSGKVDPKRLTAYLSPDVDVDEVLTIEGAAKYLKVSRATIYRLLKEKEIPARRMGSVWRFSRRALSEWIASGRDKPDSGEGE